MANEPIYVVNLTQVLDSMSKRIELVELGVAAGVTAVAESIRLAAYNKASNGTHPKGYKRPIGNGKFRYTTANPGEGPAYVSGALRNSIHANPTVKGLFGYEATVGTGLVYSRQIEFGGSNWPEGVRYPYLFPAARMVEAVAPSIFSRGYKMVVGV